MRKYKCTLILCLALIGCGRSFAQKKCKSMYDSLTNQNVYIAAEEVPIFPGGNAEMMKYLRENFIYTERESGQNRFVVEFIIDEDGKVIGERIKSKGVKEISVTESRLLKVIATMPKWNPGKCNGENIPFKYIIPINY